MENLERDEPLTPGGRLFVSPEMNQVINCVLGGENPIDIEAVKAELSNSIMVKHPRFCSLLIKDSSGREHWRRTVVDVERHLIVRHGTLSDDPPVSDDVAVNEYLADLSVSSPLSTDKPLWEIHLLMAYNAAVFRVHHALGDGISLMSMLLTCCRKADDPATTPTIGGVGASAASLLNRRWDLWTILKLAWYSFVYVLEFIISLWVKDRSTALSGGAGVELWPRKLATARFQLADMKTVKAAVSNATINDVLFGIVSCGLSRYLDIRSPNALPEGLRFTGLAMVNLRPLPGLQDLSKLMSSSNLEARWGNKFGIILIPVHYHKDSSNPLEFVKKAKAVIDKKKLSLEAPCSYKIGDLVMSIFGSKLASILNYRIICNTTFTISNAIGPREEITLAGNHVKYIRATSTALPHAITLHMVSYAGRADMQILVAKDIIPDPGVLAKCFEDSLLEMKEVAEDAMRS